MTYADYYAPRGSSPKGNKDGGFKGWWIAVVIGMVLILGNSCSTDYGWQMGVDGDGYRVTCKDGTTSLSGGKQGACSHHGGVR